MGAVLNTVVESGVNKIVIIEIRSLKIHTKFQYVWQQQSKAACCNFTEQGDGQAKYDGTQVTLHQYHQNFLVPGFS